MPPSAGDAAFLFTTRQALRRVTSFRLTRLPLDGVSLAFGHPVPEPPTPQYPAKYLFDRLPVDMVHDDHRDGALSLHQLQSQVLFQSLENGDSAWSRRFARRHTRAR